MASLNRVTLIGNLTRDIELKYTPGGTAVADVGLAVNERRKSASGEWVEETTFVDVTLWGRTAEVASEYLGKGSPILVEGRLKLDSWETDGQKRNKLRVVCERMQMLSSGGPGGSGASSSGSGGYSKAAPRSRQDDDAGGFDSGHSDSEDHGPATQNRNTTTAGQRSAQPTGDGPGYDEPDIPF